MVDHKTAVLEGRSVGLADSAVENTVLEDTVPDTAAVEDLEVDAVGVSAVLEIE